MTKKIVLFIIVVLLFLSACVSNSLQDTAIVINDAFGQEVSFSKAPTHIVVAGKQTPMLANFVYLFNESSEKISAIENRSQSSNQFLSLIDPSFPEKLTLEKGAGAEQISAFEPDTVILKTTMIEQIGNQLNDVGLKPVYVSFETIDEIYRDVRILGKILEDRDKSEVIINFYENHKNTIDLMLKDSQIASRVLLLQISESENNYVYSVPSASWLQTLMVEELGGEPVWKNDASAGGWMEVNIEQIIDWQPDIIMVINYQGQSPEMIRKLTEDAVWNQFISSSEIELKPFPYDFQSWDQPDPRWILGYASIAHFLHPDVITVDILSGLVIDFYHELYGLDLNMINDEIISLLQSQIE